MNKVKYEYAHKHCHPETCSCRKDYRVRINGVTEAWADTEKEAREIVKTIKLQLAAKALLNHFHKWKKINEEPHDDIAELFENLEEALNEQSIPI